MTLKGGNIFKKNIGQSTIEFVLVIPILIIVILTVSQFGLLIYLQNILEQSCREGVRIISTTNSNSMSYGVINRLCSDLDKNNLKIKIKPEKGSVRKVGTMVSVNLIYRYGGISNIIYFFMGKELILKAKSSMRMECN